MNSIINYFLESGIALALFGLFYLLVLKQEKSFVFNRFYLLASVLLSLVLPLISFRFESIPSELVAGTIFLQPLNFNDVTTSSSFFTSEFWMWTYVAFVILLLIRVIVKATPLLIKRRNAQLDTKLRFYVLTNSHEAYTFWDTIYIGDQLNETEKELIISHEKVHAKERHSVDILLLEVASAIFWINPIFLLYKKMIRTNHEFIADAKAIDALDKEIYVRTLATQVIKHHGFELAHFFHTSSTLKRIKMINQQNKQIMKIKQIFPFVLGLSLILAFGCEDASEQLSDMNDQEAAIAISTLQTSGVKKAEGLDDVYDMVDIYPEPEKGMPAFYQWIAENMEYPSQARKEGVEGRVFMQFIINETGEITEVKSIKGIGTGCDAEAVRVMKTATKWSPGLVDGKPVKVRMILPISFKLS